MARAATILLVVKVFNTRLENMVFTIFFVMRVYYVV